MNAQWLLQFMLLTTLPAQARLATVSLWGLATETGAVCASHMAQARLARSCSLDSDEWLYGLSAASLAGWLAPLEWGEGGELRTRLIVPEGV